MLRKLLVNNYALIDELDITFSPGLSIITGETGSGKSILLGAMSLILGQRADTSVLQDKSGKCIVEGEFDISGYGLRELFSDSDVDYEDVSIIRREINESGKSRAFINDTPVNLSILRDLGDKLVDIHSQHHNLILSENRFQLDVLDVVAGNGSIAESYRLQYGEYTAAKESLQSLRQRAEQAGADLDYYSFQLEQLTGARLADFEQRELEDELQLLTHAGEIKEALGQSVAAFEGDNVSLLGLLRDIRSALARIRPFFPPVAGPHDRLESSLIELRDISEEIGRLEASADVDPGRIDFVNSRLDLIYSLQQKHRVSSVAELIAIRDELQGRVDEIGSFEFSIGEASGKLDEARQKLAAVAGELSASRAAAIPVLEEHMTGRLKQLGIPNARFRVEHHKLDDFAGNGTDRVVFLFSANLQSPPMELSRVASGGEMSRLMLSLKSLLAKTKALPTIIFDEIDSGVSGEVAARMGRIMKEMSARMQVINITHLPQIAGKGDQHFLVYKEDVANATHTRIRLLDGEDRVSEIARMLSSDELTEAAMVNAREMMDN